MRVTSEAQRSAFERHAVPDIEQIRPGTHAIALPMPSTAIPFSLCYVVDGGDGRLHLIDTGMDSDDNWRLFRAALQSIGHDLGDIASVTITHMHSDHAGMAARVRAASGAEVRMHIADQRSMEEGGTVISRALLETFLFDWGVPASRHHALSAAARRRASTAPPVTVDTTLRGGEVIRIGHRSCRVIHTPGHTNGHISIVDDSDQLVFTGDHVLPEIHPAVGIGADRNWVDPFGDYFRALDAVASIGDYEVCPGHGYRFAGLAERCGGIAVHHGVRARQISALASSRPELSVWELARRASWARGWDRLSDGYRLSALQQTAMHAGRWR